MWTYQQTTGALTHDDGVKIGNCYSGYEAGLNNPAMQNVPDTGPIPQGRYTISAPYDIDGGPHGPFVMSLHPDPSNVMFGRGGFLMHGDSIIKPGYASRGCIVAGRDIRDQVAHSSDHDLTVIE